MEVEKSVKTSLLVAVSLESLTSRLKVKPFGMALVTEVAGPHTS